MTPAMIQFVNCPNCKKMYMVGFKGKDTREKKLKGGSLDGTPYVAIGTHELRWQPDITVGDEIPCPGCGTPVKVEDSQESGREKTTLITGISPF